MFLAVLSAFFLPLQEQREQRQSQAERVLELLNAHHDRFMEDMTRDNVVSILPVDPTAVPEVAVTPVSAFLLAMHAGVGLPSIPPPPQVAELHAQHAAFAIAQAAAGGAAAGSAAAAKRKAVASRPTNVPPAQRASAAPAKR